MPNRINRLLLKEYLDEFREADSLISIGYEGLPALLTDKLRADLASRGIKLKFVKNRIAAIAFKELGHGDVKSICLGQTAFAVGGDDPVGLARFFVDFGKENKALKIHGALVEKTILDEAGVTALSQSPSKAELKAQLVGQALGPGGKVAGALMGPARKIAGQLKTLIEKLEKGTEAA